MSFTTCILVMIGGALGTLARYVVSVRLAIHPDLILDSGFVLPVATLYGAFSGVFLGRAAQLWRLPLRRPATPVIA